MRNQRLERAMADAGVTRTQLARACDVTAKTVERWITTGRVPWLRHQFVVADQVGVPARDLWPDSAPDDEFVAFYPERAAVPRETWFHLLDGITDAFEMLVYAGMFFHEQHPRLLAVLRHKADTGVKVRLLFGNPDEDAVSRRGAEEGIGDAVSAKVRNVLSHYRPLAGSDGIAVRLHATTLYASIYRFDDQILVNPHIYGRPAAHSPVLHLRRRPAGHAFDAYLECFERVWTMSIPAWEATG